MGVYTVTQEEWQTVMVEGVKNPNQFKGEKKLPVESVSWDDCQQFLAKLKEKDKKPYCLPTDAEWEYVCRAGTTTPFNTGNTISTEQANYNIAPRQKPLTPRVRCVRGLAEIIAAVWYFLVWENYLLPVACRGCPHKYSLPNPDRHRLGE